MKPPFKTPVRVEDGKHLVAADCELILEFHSATEAEIAFIVQAINGYAQQGEVKWPGSTTS